MLLGSHTGASPEINLGAPGAPLSPQMGVKHQMRTLDLAFALGTEKGTQKKGPVLLWEVRNLSSPPQEHHLLMVCPGQVKIFHLVILSVLWKAGNNSRLAYLRSVTGAVQHKEHGYFIFG